MSDTVARPEIKAHRRRHELLTRACSPIHWVLSDRKVDADNSGQA